MREILEKSRVQEVAGFELSALGAADTLPEGLERARITSAGTPIYDIGGEPLFNRVPLYRSKGRVAFVDIAVNPIMGSTLLAITSGFDWSERKLRAEAKAVAKSRRTQYDQLRFVAYSYPKIAVQFLQRGEEVEMLELFSWEPIPEVAVGASPTEPSNFERWSLVEALEQRAPQREQAFAERLGVWDEAITPRRKRTMEIGRVDRVPMLKVVKPIELTESRVLHYTTQDSGHKPCFGLHGQETGVWCVGASTQMFLEFWRYEYTQTRIANELGLGTHANPNGLPYNRVGDVPLGLEALTSKGMDATMHTNPAWALFRTEIKANRPLISFVPGHSRAVAGYTRSMLSLPGQLPFRGLLVYDPWPPNVGAITQWENFDTQTYQYAYTAKVPLV